MLEVLGMELAEQVQILRDQLKNEDPEALLTYRLVVSIAQQMMERRRHNG